MSAKNSSRHETAFTMSIEAREGVTTGISAADRARTIQVAIHPATRPADLRRPGHIFPLRAKQGDPALKSAPHFAPRRRLDETAAARKPKLAFEG